MSSTLVLRDLVLRMYRFMKMSIYVSDSLRHMKVFATSQSFLSILLPLKHSTNLYILLLPLFSCLDLRK